MIIDNKKFDVPTTPAARAYQAKQNMHSELGQRSYVLACLLLAKNFVRAAQRRQPQSRSRVREGEKGAHRART